MDKKMLPIEAATRAAIQKMVDDYFAEYGEQLAEHLDKEPTPDAVADRTEDVVSGIVNHLHELWGPGMDIRYQMNWIKSDGTTSHRPNM